MIKKILLFIALLLSFHFSFSQSTGVSFGNYSSSGSLGTASSTIDIYDFIKINQSTPFIVISIPNPTSVTSSKQVTIANSGSVQFTINGYGTVPPKRSVIIKWGGLSNGWFMAGDGPSVAPITSESDPNWTLASINYYTKSESDSRYIQSFTEIDPIWIAASTNYFTKSQSDLRYLQSFTESDPEWTSQSSNYWNKSQSDARYLLITATTSNITEGSNLYFTTARARSSLSAGPGIWYDSSSGVISNVSPDQVVSISGGNRISVTGFYPNFTVSYTGRKQETFSGSTDSSGEYSITFATPYPIPPDVQATIIPQSTTNQFIRITEVTTTGCTVHVFQRNAVTILSVEVLLAATVNVSGAQVGILVTER